MTSQIWNRMQAFNKISTGDGMKNLRVILNSLPWCVCGQIAAFKTVMSQVLVWPGGCSHFRIFSWKRCSYFQRGTVFDPHHAAPEAAPETSKCSSGALNMISTSCLSFSKSPEVSPKSSQFTFLEFLCTIQLTQSVCSSPKRYPAMGQFSSKSEPLGIPVNPERTGGWASHQWWENPTQLFDHGTCTENPPVQHTFTAEK